MEILLNELSLAGQFSNEDTFFDNFDSILRIIKIIDILDFTMSKEYTFFNSSVTSSMVLSDFLKLKTDRARKMKSFLAKLTQSPPFWNETQMHDCAAGIYMYVSNNICGSSLAESYERDRCVLSFSHPKFMNTNLQVKKNTTTRDIYNIIEKNLFLDELLCHGKISPAVYCEYKFKDTNLNFSKYEEDYGFSSLDSSTQVDAFIHAFNDFSLMTWDDIMRSDGLEYKKYNKPNERKKGWFRKGTYKNTDIYKFRVSQEYRCFGFRKGDEFFVLRFEIDHSISNNG